MLAKDSIDKSRDISDGDLFVSIDIHYGLVDRSGITLAEDYIDESGDIGYRDKAIAIDIANRQDRRCRNGHRHRKVDIRLHAKIIVSNEISAEGFGSKLIGVCEAVAGRRKDILTVLNGLINPSDEIILSAMTDNPLWSLGTERGVMPAERELLSFKVTGLAPRIARNSYEVRLIGCNLFGMTEESALLVFTREGHNPELLARVIGRAIPIDCLLANTDLVYIERYNEGLPMGGLLGGSGL